MYQNSLGRVGVGTGLGRAMAERFLGLGADVAICGRRVAVCEETAAVWRAQFPGRRIDTFGVDIRNAQSVEDRDLPSDVRIGWSNDGSAVLLAINGTVHAVFNFGSREACCLTGFPPPDGRGWAAEGHAWRDSMLGAFAR